MLEEERLVKLAQVYEEYQGYRSQLISRAVMKTKHNVHESAERFKSSVKTIETEKMTKIASFFNRLTNSRSQQGYRGGQSQMIINSQQIGQLAPQEQEEINNIEKEANMKTVHHIQSQSDENNRYEGEEQERLHGLRHLATYQNELEKALIFVVGARHISNLNEQLGSVN
jgi:hypothetical protein